MGAMSDATNEPRKRTTNLREKHTRKTHGANPSGQTLAAARSLAARRAWRGPRADIGSWPGTHLGRTPGQPAPGSTPAGQPCPDGQPNQAGSRLHPGRLHPPGPRRLPGGAQHQPLRLSPADLWDNGEIPSLKPRGYRRRFVIQKGSLSELPTPAACLYCDRLPPQRHSGVCSTCWNMTGVRQLFCRRKGWTTRWEMHLRALATRASAKLECVNAKSECMSSKEVAHG